jgi:hypothetical protein
MPGVVHIGGMIALVPSRDDAARLAVAGGEAAEELHLTLAYLGEDVTGWPPELGPYIAAELRGLARHGGGPVTAQAFGHALFNPNGDHDQQPCAVYLVGDSAIIPALHATASKIAEIGPGAPAQRPVFVPHITAGYGIAVTALTYTGPVVFDRLRLALAGSITDVPLDSPVGGAAGDPDAAIKAASSPVRRSAFSIRRPMSTEIKAATPPPEEQQQTQQRQKGKRYVASKAGETRYGKPIGTELGTSRGGEAADTAQRDEGAKGRYGEMMKMAAGERAAWIAKLSDDELGRLTKITYSFRSANPEVVAARNALAAALRKRGKDVADYGSLAGKTGAKTGSRTGAAKPGAPKKTSSAGKSGTGKAGAKKGSLSDVEDRAWRARAADSRGRILVDDLTEAARKKLIAAGWKGRPGDGAEALYPPQKEAAVPADIETKVMSPDPRAAKLRSYWAHGEGRAKWNTFRELRNHLRKYVPKHMVDGLTANIYKLARGTWPGRRGGGEKSLADDVETAVLTAEELKAAAAITADAGPEGEVSVEKALDAHAALDITSEDAYEKALADEVEWEVDGRGEIEPVDESDDDADADPRWDDPEWDGEDEPVEADGGADGEADGETAEGDAELAALEALFGGEIDGTDDEEDDDESAA